MNGLGLGLWVQYSPIVRCIIKCGPNTYPYTLLYSNVLLMLAANIIGQYFA